MISSCRAAEINKWLRGGSYKHLNNFFFFFCRSDAVAGVDQSSGKVQLEDQDPSADPGEPRCPAAAQGTEKRQRVIYSLRLLVPHGVRAPQTGLSGVSVFTLHSYTHMIIKRMKWNFPYQSHH